jgi:hypothetical protein
MSTFLDGSLNYTIVSSISPYTASLTGHDATLGPNVTIPQTALNGPISYTVIDISNSALNTFLTMTLLSIPDSVTNIGTSAFAGCENLSSVNLNSTSNLKTISDYAFQYTYSLSSITIPPSVTFIGIGAFNNSSITSITFTPTSLLNSIGAGAFQQCSINSFNFPSSVTSIGSQFFTSSYNLTAVTFDSNSQLSRISNSAFNDCLSLVSIIIPSSVTFIENNSFNGCASLGPQLTIPSSVTEIATDAFKSCTSLTSVYFDASNSITLPIFNGACFDQFTTATNKAYYYHNVLASNGSPATNTTFTSAGFNSSQEINSTEPITCFKEDTKILTNKGYIPIQNLRKGDLIKTLLHNYVPIVMIGKKDIHHPAKTERIKDQLYKCTHSEYPEIFEDLVLTGCHSILVDEFANDEQKEKTIEVNKIIYITDNNYRLPACADHRASVYEHPGTYTIYHIALENDDYYMNYGIYANGLLVETCSKRYLKEVANMTLID